jgi:hypothetical protein
MAAGKIFVSLGRAAWRAVRLALYVLLLVLGRVLLPIANLAIAVGIVVFFGYLIFRPDLSVPMWAGAGLAVGATAVQVFYEAALHAVAPAGVVIVSDV